MLGLVLLVFEECRIWSLGVALGGTWGLVRGLLGTLLGPEETPCGCLLSSQPGSPNAPLVGVVVVVVGWGVVVC